MSNENAHLAVGIGTILALSCLLLAIVWRWELLGGVLAGIVWSYAGWRYYA